MAFGVTEAINSLSSLAESAIKRVWPDPEKQAIELRKLKELEQAGDLKELELYVELLLGQIEINKLDAQSASWFQSGWRPSIGWIGALSLALVYIPKALLLSVMWGIQCYLLLTSPDVDIATLTLPAYPDLGVSDLLGLLGSMLGIGVMRTIEKRSRVDTKTMGVR
ncbi:MAG: holin family protein [Gammaproteobacteria bacterium]|nr:holin family protein [Gammaproteobacteria bacterium]